MDDASIDPRPPRTSDERGVLVFGYGSLVALDELARFLGRDEGEVVDAAPAVLNGYVRCWNVAVENAPVPGYKVYLDERGERPEVAITFLNVRPSAGRSVNGVVVRVSRAELERIRRRERNYRLVDLSTALGAFDLASERGEPVYVSVGRPEAVARFGVAQQAGRATVVCAYRERVERAFRSLGAGALAAYRASTEPFEGACLPLCRLDLP